MNVRLLNDGGYYFLDLVKFPVIVEGNIVNYVNGIGKCIQVSTAELKRIGANFDWDCEDDCTWSFRVDSECEVLV